MRLHNLSWLTPVLLAVLLVTAPACSRQAQTTSSTLPPSSTQTNIGMTSTTSTIISTTPTGTTSATASTTAVSTSPISATSTPPSSIDYSKTVVAKLYAFFPQTLNVSVGTTVTWINQDAEDHTVTTYPGAPAPFDLYLKGNNGTNSFTFTKPGTYNYTCTIHTSMFGMIIVK